MKEFLFKVKLGIKWVAGFPGAVVYNYRRQRAIDQQMDNLTDYGFLDRIDKDA